MAMQLQLCCTVTNTYMLTQLTILFIMYELHYELVGKECFQEVYRLFLSLQATTPTLLADML